MVANYFLFLHSDKGCQQEANPFEWHLANFFYLCIIWGKGKHWGPVELHASYLHDFDSFH